MTPEHRARISASLRAYYREHPETIERIKATKHKRFRQSVAARVAEPSEKKCSQCGNVKLMEDYFHVKRKLKCGLVSVFPQQPCKKCHNENNKARYHRQKAEGIDVLGRKRESQAKQDRVKRRRTRRESEAARRRREGRLIRGAYKHKDPDPPTRSHNLPTKPLTDLLNVYLEKNSVGEIAAACNIVERRIYAVREEETPTISLSTADKVLHGLGCPEQMNILYPLEEEKLVGYQILDPDGILEQ